MWTISKIVKKGEYLYAVVKEHPKATKYGYVLHHRVLMENELGRLLLDTEVVHHKDHNRHNNDISNLQVMDRYEHNRHHASMQVAKYVSLICPNCNKEFKKRKSQCIKTTKQHKCSRKCNGQYSRRLQLERIKNGREF